MRRKMAAAFVAATVAAGWLWFAAPALAAGVSITDTADGMSGNFSPSTVTIQEGESVTWTYSSAGASLHSVQGEGGLASLFLNPGDTYTTSFAAAGTYDYHCGVHPTTMFGTVVVEAPVTTTVPPTTLPPATAPPTTAPPTTAPPTTTPPTTTRAASTTTPRATTSTVEPGIVGTGSTVPSTPGSIDPSASSSSSTSTAPRSTTTPSSSNTDPTDDQVAAGYGGGGGGSGGGLVVILLVAAVVVAGGVFAYRKMR